MFHLLHLLLSALLYLLHRKFLRSQLQLVMSLLLHCLLLFRYKVLFQNYK